MARFTLINEANRRAVIDTDTNEISIQYSENYFVDVLTAPPTGVEEITQDEIRAAIIAQINNPNDAVLDSVRTSIEADGGDLAAAMDYIKTETSKFVTSAGAGRFSEALLGALNISAVPEAMPDLSIDDVDVDATATELINVLNLRLAVPKAELSAYETAVGALAGATDIDALKVRRDDAATGLETLKTAYVDAVNDAPSGFVSGSSVDDYAWPDLAKLNAEKTALAAGADSTEIDAKIAAATSLNTVKSAYGTATVRLETAEKAITDAEAANVPLVEAVEAAKTPAVAAYVEAREAIEETVTSSVGAITTAATALATENKVKEVQSVMALTGHYSRGIDGDAGRGTKAGLIAYAEEYGIDISAHMDGDAIKDDALSAAIDQVHAEMVAGLASNNKVTAEVADAFEETVRTPDNNRDIAVQSVLKMQGGDVGSIDGVLGPKSRGAFKTVYGYDAPAAAVPVVTKEKYDADIATLKGEVGAAETRADEAEAETVEVQNAAEAARAAAVAAREQAIAEARAAVDPERAAASLGRKAKFDHVVLEDLVLDVDVQTHGDEYSYEISREYLDNDRDINVDSGTVTVGRENGISFKDRNDDDGIASLEAAEAQGRNGVIRLGSRDQIYLTTRGANGDVIENNITEYVREHGVDSLGLSALTLDPASDQALKAQNILESIGGDFDPQTGALITLKNDGLTYDIWARTNANGETEVRIIGDEFKSANPELMKRLNEQTPPALRIGRRDLEDFKSLESARDVIGGFIAPAAEDIAARFRLSNEFDVEILDPVPDGDESGPKFNRDANFLNA